MGGDPSNGIIWSLKRLFDPPAEVERDEREQHATMRGQKRQEGTPPVFACRVCGHESEVPAFCPDCLADTMKPR